MSVYRRGKTWWYNFVFCGQYIQESAKTKSKTVAKEAEKTRRRELEEGYNNITPEDRNRRILTLAKAAEEYQEQYEARNSLTRRATRKYCIKHLVEHLGSKMLIQITDHAVVAYQQARLKEDAAGKTINEEVGELFRIMGGFRGNAGSNVGPIVLRWQDTLEDRLHAGRERVAQLRNDKAATEAIITPAPIR